MTSTLQYLKELTRKFHQLKSGKFLTTKYFNSIFILSIILGTIIKSSYELFHLCNGNEIIIPQIRGFESCNLRIYIYFFGCAECSSLCRFFSSCGEQGLLSSGGAQASHCSGFSRGAWALERMGFNSCNTWLSRCGSQTLQHMLVSCGTQA